MFDSSDLIGDRASYIFLVLTYEKYAYVEYASDKVRKKVFKETLKGLKLKFSATA